MKSLLVLAKPHPEKKGELLFLHMEHAKKGIITGPLSLREMWTWPDDEFNKKNLQKMLKGNDDTSDFQIYRITIEKA